MMMIRYEVHKHILSNNDWENSALIQSGSGKKTSNELVDRI